MNTLFFVVWFDVNRSNPTGNFNIYFLYLCQLDVGSSIRDSSDYETDFIGEKVDALRGRYIRQLTAVLIQHVPAFWRLALSVFSGKFAKVF